jgi:hypothetical protein
VRVRGAGGGRVSIAGVVCYRPGDRPHLYYQLLVYRRRKGEAKSFSNSLDCHVSHIRFSCFSGIGRLTARGENFQAHIAA